MSLVVEGLSHRFGNQPALSDVSIRVETGDCYGFIGHNGAGKTTTMRIMLGLLRPDAGRVIVDGFDAAEHVREARARMGGLIETPGFHSHWSGRKNLLLLDRLAGGSSDVDALLELVGLGGTGRKPVRAYSQGMRQRLGVAQALLGDPQYVLLDEPTNGLDPDGIREVRELVIRLTREEGRTVFISSHQLHELSGVCNRVGVLRNGRLVLEGELDELLAGDAYELRTPGGVRAVDLGGDAPAVVLRRLVEEGTDIVSFAPRTPTLEEIYHGEEHPQVQRPRVDAGPPPRRLARPGALPRMLRHEARRWLSQWTAPLMLLLLPALIGVVRIVNRHSDAVADQMKLAGKGVASVTTVNAFEGVAFALHTGVWVLCFVVAGLASQSLAGELAQGTLRNVLLRPVTRVQVAMGKYMALICAAFAGYAVLLGSAVAVSAWYFDFTGVADVLPNGKLFEHVTADQIRPEFWRAIRSPLLPLAAYAGLGLLAGAIVRRGARALALGLGFAVAADIGRELFRAHESWFPAAHVPSLRKTSPIDAFADAAQGFANVTQTPGANESWSVPIVWILLTFGCVLLVFRRRYVP